MSENLLGPSAAAIDKAKKHPNGWVYEIDASYKARGKKRCQGRMALPVVFPKNGAHTERRHAAAP